MGEKLYFTFLSSIWKPFPLILWAEMHSVHGQLIYLLPLKSFHQISHLTELILESFVLLNVDHIISIALIT